MSKVRTTALSCATSSPGAIIPASTCVPGRASICVANVENLPQATGSVGTVVSMSTFEHVRQFWKGFDEVRRVLRPDGVFVVACPFFFRIHNYPYDYWRFTPRPSNRCWRTIPARSFGWHGAKQRPASVWSSPSAHGHAAITPEQFARHRTLVQKYAYEPEDSLTRQWRYHLARLLCAAADHLPRISTGTGGTPYA